MATRAVSASSLARASSASRALPLAGLRSAIYPRNVDKLSVSNFVPICEVKGLYQKARVYVQRSESSQRALDRGTAVHAKLDVDALPMREIFGEFASQISYADRLRDMARRWTLLARKGAVREVNLFGSMRNIQLYGVADGFEHDGTTLVENKTCASMPPAEWKMRLALHQALVYNHMMGQMMDPEFDLGPFIDRGFAEGAQQRIKEELGTSFEDILDECHDALRELRASPPQVKRIHLVYADAKSSQTYEFALDLEAQHQLMASAGEMWAGDREPVPVRSDGAFSCRFCEYKSLCLFVKRFEEKTGQRL